MEKVVKTREIQLHAHKLRTTCALDVQPKLHKCCSHRHVLTAARANAKAPIHVHKAEGRHPLQNTARRLLHRPVIRKHRNRGVSQATIAQSSAECLCAETLTCSKPQNL